MNRTEALRRLCAEIDRADMIIRLHAKLPIIGDNLGDDGVAAQKARLLKASLTEALRVATSTFAELNAYREQNKKRSVR